MVKRRENTFNEADLLEVRVQGLHQGGLVHDLLHERRGRQGRLDHFQAVRGHVGGLEVHVDGDGDRGRGEDVQEVAAQHLGHLLDALLPGDEGRRLHARDPGEGGLVGERLLLGHVLLHQDGDLQVLLEVVGHAAGVEQQDRRDAHEEQHQTDADHRGHPGPEEPAPDESVAEILHSTPNFVQS